MLHVTEWRHREGCNSVAIADWCTVVIQGASLITLPLVGSSSETNIVTQGSGSLLAGLQYMRRFGHKPQCIQKRDAESDGFCQAGKVRALMLSADVTAFKKTCYFLMFMSEGKEVLCCRTCATLVAHACCDPSRTPPGAQGLYYPGLVNGATGLPLADTDSHVSSEHTFGGVYHGLRGWVSSTDVARNFRGYVPKTLSVLDNQNIMQQG